MLKLRRQWQAIRFYDSIIKALCYKAVSVRGKIEISASNNALPMAFPRICG